MSSFLRVARAYVCVCASCISCDKIYYISEFLRNIREIEFPHSFKINDLASRRRKNMHDSWSPKIVSRALTKECENSESNK